MTLPTLPAPAGEAETTAALSAFFDAQPVYVAPDDPEGPDYATRTAIHRQHHYGLTVETVGNPLPL